MDTAKLYEEARQAAESAATIRRNARLYAPPRNLCNARHDSQRCGKRLTLADRQDNESGICAECAGILSDNGEW